MQELFTTQPSNRHQSLLPSANSVDIWHSMVSQLNRRRLVEKWPQLQFELQTVDAQSALVPNICAVTLPGIIAFGAQFRSIFLPTEESNFELLPIDVQGQSWLLLNCLCSADEYDRRRSRVMVGANGEVFLVVELHMAGAKAPACEFFTLNHSNRGQLFVRDSFKRRVEEVHMEGIAFRKIGSID